MNNFNTFESYSNEDHAKEISNQLKLFGIKNMVVSEIDNLDTNFVGSKFGNKYFIKMEGSDFEKARNFLKENTVINLEEIDKEYMLLHFSNKELLEVVAKPDEWGIYNFKLASHLLNQRGFTSINEIELIKEEHINQLAKSSNADGYYLFMGYTFMLLMLIIPILWEMGIIGHFGFTLLPPWFSLVLGWVYAYSKKTLPNGKRVYSFSSGTRIHGKVLFFGTLLGILSIALFFSGNVRPLTYIKL